MHFTDEFVEEVRNRNDIVSVISGVVALKKKGGRYFGVCPFHNEKTPSFSVSEESQLYYCFGCGAGGTVITFIQNYENFTFQESVKYLADRAGMQIPEDDGGTSARQAEDRKKQLLALYRETAIYYYRCLRTPEGKSAMDYFLRRGLSPETIKSNGLGYSPRSARPLYEYLKQKGFSDELISDSQVIKLDGRGPWDRFYNRAIFPIFDIHRRVIAFGGRVMGDGEPKYLNSPETDIFDKSRNLFGLNIAKNTKKKYFLLCEGYMDVLSLHQAGFDNAVATLGTSLTPGHAAILKRYGKDVILTYDSDNAGIRAAMRAIPLLRDAGIRVKVLELSPHKDPDEFIVNKGMEAFEQRITDAVPSFFFERDQEYKAIDKGDPDSVSAFQRGVSSKIAEFNDPLTRANYMEAAAQRYSIRKDALRESVNEIGEHLIPAAAAEPRNRLPDRKRKNSRSYAMEAYLVNWLAAGEAPADILDDYILPEYFENVTLGNAAALLADGIRAGKPIKPADIISRLGGDEETARELTEVFCVDYAFEDKTTVNYLKTLKREFLNRILKLGPSPEVIQKAALDRAALDKEVICLHQNV